MATTAKTKPKTTTTKSKAKPKAAPKAADTGATVVTEKAVVAGPTLKKKDFIERVVERSGVKKKDAKPAVEAALQVLGEAIAAGEELNLPEFGKLRVNRAKELAAANVYICKLRRAKAVAGDPAKEPLAEEGE